MKNVREEMNPLTDKSDGGEAETESEKQEIQEEQDELQGDPRLRHMLFDPVAAMRIRTNGETMTIIRSMVAGGNTRNLIPIPEDYRQRCEVLSEIYPNFGRFIDECLLPEMALAEVKGGAFSLPPTVFVGSPGVGKSLFAQEGLCTNLFEGALPFKRFNLEVSQASFELVGSSRGWSDHQPGQLLRWMSERKLVPEMKGFKLGNGIAANGIVICEELDKAPPSRERLSVMNALIQLLEPMTAKCFADQSAPELTLNLSRLSFVFTANSLEGIPDPVLSRLNIVEIEPLTQEQAEAIALSQYKKLVDELDLPFATPKLTRAGLRVLGRATPRRQRLLLRQAFGRAIAFRASVLELPESVEKPKASIGFL